MRRIFIIIYCILISLVGFAQNDVTKFLGIPVDGSKSEMIRKLKAKGFTQNLIGGVEVLKGRFNGSDVNLHIITEKGKVARVMVCDDNTFGETDIKIRFNRLCQQFAENGKYIGVLDYTIPEDEDISYEISVNDKRYEAVFYQLPNGKTLEQLQADILSQIRAKYTPEQLQNLSDEAKTELISGTLETLIDLVHNKPVWFMISELSGKYYISIFYDNEYNMAQGEDL